MNIQQNVPLKDHSTMRLGGAAQYLGIVESRQDILDAVAWAKTNALPLMMIGGGSNIIWKDEGFPGLVLMNGIKGFEPFEEDEFNTYLTIGAGENWDSVVERSVQAGLSGIEALSLKIVLHLSKQPPAPPFYKAVEEYFQEHNITNYTPAAVREAVIAIRSAKLPDPAKVANNGSFFANPIISGEQFTELQDMYPEMPHWAQDDDSMKIPAAWLVEQAGLKDYHDADTGMATWPNQSLVFVNEHAKSTADLLKFKQKVIDAVHAKFNITLVQEPELLP
jgi:UDP-N-acetylenolpyruvoylglucosamine reductase